MGAAGGWWRAGGAGPRRGKLPPAAPGGSRRRFWDLIYDLADGGTTVLVTTHYMDEADYCDRLGMMLGGRLVCQGTPDYVRSCPMQ